MAPANAPGKPPVTRAFLSPVMRIVATPIVSHPLIVFMNMRGVRMTGLIAVVPVRSALIPASHTAAVVIAAFVMPAVVSSIVRTSLIVGVPPTSGVPARIVVGANATLPRLCRSWSVGRDVLLPPALLVAALLAVVMLARAVLIAATLIPATSVVLRHAQSAEDDGSCEQSEYAFHVLSPIL